MTQADAEDIRRVLAICFRGQSELDAMDIERILSLDMGWLKPDEAEASVQALISSGWLKGGQENLSPVDEVASSSTPLGRGYQPSGVDEDEKSSTGDRFS